MRESIRGGEPLPHGVSAPERSPAPRWLGDRAFPSGANLTAAGRSSYDGGVRFVGSAPGLVALALALAACTHTVEGTGPPVSSTSGTSGTGDPADCAAIRGTWDVRGTLRNGCAPDSCTISSTDCVLTLDCRSGKFFGQLEDGKLTWVGKDQAVCTASLASSGLKAEGSCSFGTAPACSFVATKSAP
jgi:hypothetical protein